MKRRITTQPNKTKCDNKTATAKPARQRAELTCERSGVQRSPAAAIASNSPATLHSGASESKNRLSHIQNLTERKKNPLPSSIAQRLFAIRHKLLLENMIGDFQVILI
jgi:hypothetical protein